MLFMLGDPLERKFVLKSRPVIVVVGVMQDMRIHQMSLERKMDERIAQLLEQRPVGSALDQQPRPFQMSHEFGFPLRPPQTEFVRGCYWDGG